MQGIHFYISSLQITTEAQKKGSSKLTTADKTVEHKGATHDHTTA